VSVHIARKLIFECFCYTVAKYRTRDSLLFLDFVFIAVIAKHLILHWYVVLSRNGPMGHLLSSQTIQYIHLNNEAKTLQVQQFQTLVLIRIRRRSQTKVWSVLINPHKTCGMLCFCHFIWKMV